jgi:hypothetical protein
VGRSPQDVLLSKVLFAEKENFMKFVNYLGQPIDVSGHRPLTDKEISLSEVPVTKGVSGSGSGFVEAGANELSSSEIIIKAVKFDDDFTSGAVVFEIDQASKINANFAILSRGKDSYFDLFDLDQKLSDGAVRLLGSVLEDSCASAEAFCLHFDGEK